MSGITLDFTKAQLYVIDFEWLSVGRIRFVGFLDDEQSQVHKLVHKYKVALGLRTDYGTQPNVYYIPPTESPAKFDAEGKIIEGSTRLPVEELEKLFEKFD